ncbi:Uncharacterized protein Adt_24594 [Abeliophyllum distichum]|uniref:Uncharacterized protein n=1 Tax=Abeliophyllum distichum TaxID=126358 RepID=A0ABD1SHB9_9LAMI
MSLFSLAPPSTVEAGDGDKLDKLFNCSNVVFRVLTSHVAEISTFFKVMNQICEGLSSQLRTLTAKVQSGFSVLIDRQTGLEVPQVNLEQCLKNLDEASYTSRQEEKDKDG